MYEIYQGISHPGCIPAYPGYGYMHRDLYETITSSHLTLQTKQGRIKNFKLSGVTRQVETTGAQLFDAGTAKDSYYIKDDTGEESTTATQKDKFASDYIPVSGIESITFNAETAWGAWYDASKLYISGFGSSGAGRTLVVPENAAYMRFTGNIENKNVIMLNAGDTALPWEQYTGTQPSPSADYPQEVQGVGVRTAQLANLPDIAPTTSNGLTWGCKDGVITVTGTAQKNSDSTTVGLYAELHLQPGTYTVSGYDPDVEVYVRITRADDKTIYYQKSPFVAEATDKLTIIYAQVPTGKTVNKTIYPMLNAGTAALPFEPYGYKFDLVSKNNSKNLLNQQRMLDFILQKPGASIVQFDGRRCLKLDGAFNFPDFNLYEGFEPDKRYTLTFDGFYEKYKTEAHLSNGFAFTLQNGGRNLSLMDVSDIGTWKHKTTTSDTGVSKLTFTYGVSSVVYIDLDTIQLEEGTISTPYQPYAYYTAPIYTREPLTQWDHIEYRNGEYGVTRRGTTYTFTGQERFNKYGSNGFALTKPDMLPGNYRNDGYCNRFPCAKGTSATKGIWFGADNNQYIYFLDVLGVATSVSEFAAWLQANPTTIVYQLAEEVWEPLPAISQQALHNLPTYKGTTIIGTTDPLEPEITVSYRAQTDYSKLPGLEVDYEKCTTTRLGAAKNLTAGAQFNRFPMYGNRRRCNVLDDGTITACHGDPNYKEDGSNGQVMVYQPKFYYQVVPLKTDPQTDGIGYHLRRAQYWVSPKPQPGFKLHPAFINASGQEVDHILLSAYESSLYDTSEATYILDDAQVMDVAADKLSSIAGAKPASGKTQLFTRQNAEQLAQNRGSGWHGDTIKAESANQLLMMIELGTLNTQAAIGQGVASIPDTPNTENNSIITGGTSSLGSNTGMANGTSGKVSVTYRGMENPWGNIWKMVDGINAYMDNKGLFHAYVCKNFAFTESNGTGNYEEIGFHPANTDGYISAMGYSDAFDWLFIPSETRNSSTPLTDDYYFCNPTWLNSWRIALLGAAWPNSDKAGAFYWHLYTGVELHYRNVGSRLIYVPTDNLFNINRVFANPVPEAFRYYKYDLGLSPGSYR